MHASAESVHLAYDLADGEEWLTVHAARNGFAHARTTTFPCRPWSLDELETAGYELLRSSGSVGLKGGCALLLRRGTEAVLEFHGDPRGGVMQLQVAGVSPSVADEVCTWFDDTFRENRLPREETRVPIHFWTMSSHGPRPMRMMIEAPTWEEIADNYSPAIRDDLERSMHAGRDNIEGVALWRGEPGTGKTTALRALAMEWSNWCDVHVIVDPEVFLGDQASYLMDVLFSFQDPHTAHLNAMMANHMAGGMVLPPMVGDMEVHLDTGVGDEEDEDHEYAPSDFYDRYRQQSMGSRAKLIVLEDAGELVTSSARANAGQALSRLLNISDGMLGQGANISVLVTTNEELGNLHPAIQRPGRSWAQIEFDSFSRGEAAAWLAAHGVEHEPVGPASIAELYSIVRGDRIIRLDNISAPAPATR